MALRLSTGLRNFILQHGSLKDALQNGRIEVYTGSQPASADSAVQGTLLATLTKSSGAHTAEVLAAGSITLTGGASGSVNTVTVDGVNIIPQGAVAFNTSLNQTASDLADAINAGLSSPEYTAVAVGAIVTITAKRGSGVSPNGFVVTATLTTITASYVNMAGGVAPVNGLSFGSASAGSIAKNAAEAWTGVAVAGGTAGWFRYYGSVADTGIADSSESTIRLDGSVATSGGQLTMSNTTVVAGATQTGTSLTVTMPSS